MKEKSFKKYYECKKKTFLKKTIKLKLKLNFM